MDNFRRPDGLDEPCCPITFLTHSVLTDRNRPPHDRRGPEGFASSHNDTDILNTHTFEVLSLKGKPVRIATIDGIPHFSLTDICSAVGWSTYTGREMRNPQCFNGGAIKIDQPDGTTDHYLSTVAVWHLTHLVCPSEGQGIAAWTKRETLARCPDVPANDPRVYLQLTEEFQLPAWKPYKYSGRRAEWYALQKTPEYENRFALRLEAMKYDPLHQAAEKARLEMLAEIAAANAGGAR